MNNILAVIEKLLAAVEALTRHAPVGSASHDLIADAKATFAPEKATEPEATAEPLIPVMPPEEPQAEEPSETKTKISAG